MIKKLTLFLVVMFVASCTANKSIIQTTKNGNFTPYSPDYKSNKRPLAIKEQDSTKVDTSKMEILAATTRVKVTPEMVLAYIEQFKEISKNNMTQFGIPSSIILAQGILESGAGTGPLSTSANNHFGIKCHKEWTGPSVKYDDDTEQECFRKYEQASESYKDHALFLTSRPRYSDLFKLNKDDYKAWANGLKAAGYATDPMYPDKLIGIIERYQLGKYDADVLGKVYVPIIPTVITPKVEIVKIDTPKTEAPKENKINTETPKVETSVVSAPKTETPKQSSSISIVEKKLSSVPVSDAKSIVIVEKKLSSIPVNDTKSIVDSVKIIKPVVDTIVKSVVNKPIVIKNEIVQTETKSGNYQVAQGDTLYSISKKFNLTVEDLKKKNNMLDNAISIGQTLIVQ